MALEERDQMTVTEAVQRYLLQGSGSDHIEAQSEINRFVRWVGGSKKIGNLSSHEVASYVEHLGNSTADMARRINPVKAFLAYAKKEGYTPTNLGVNLRVKKSGGSGSSSKSTR